MTNPPIEFFETPEKLREWISDNAGIAPDGREIGLESPTFEGMDLAKTDFSRATLNAPNFENAKLGGVNFGSARLFKGSWKGASLSGEGKFDRATLSRS